MGGKPLTPEAGLGLAAVINTVTNGRNTMPPFGGALSQDDIQDVATYLVKELIPAAAP